MSTAIDVVCGAVIFFSILAYVFRGFFKTIINIAAYAASVAGAILLRPVFRLFYESIGLNDSLKNTISDLCKNAEKAAENITAEELSDNIRLPESFKNMLLSQSAETGGEAVTLNLSESIFEFCMNGLALFTGFIIISLILRIVIHFAVDRDSLPGFGAIDRLLGGLLGAVIGVLYVYFAVVFVYTLSAAGAIKEIAGAIDNTYLAKSIYEYCPITFMILTRIFR